MDLEPSACDQKLGHGIYAANVTAPSLLPAKIFESWAAWPDQNIASRQKFRPVPHPQLWKVASIK